MAQTAAADELAVLLKIFHDEFLHLRPGAGRGPADFHMGRDDGESFEGPRHLVAMKPFAIARYEVPQNLWQAVMGNNPSRWKGPRNSVEMVSYDDAKDFCRAVTQKMREAKLLTARQEVRLPSEAQWEYAARAGTNTLYSFGNAVDLLDSHAWSARNAAGNDPPVGAKRPNAWIMYDVHGYLWEWCADAWHDTYDGAPADGSVWEADDPDAKPARVLRGGSWKDPAERLTSSYRRPGAPAVGDDAIGLRPVLVEIKP